MINHIYSNTCIQTYKSGVLEQFEILKDPLSLVKTSLYSEYRAFIRVADYIAAFRNMDMFHVRKLITHWSFNTCERAILV